MKIISKFSVLILFVIVSIVSSCKKEDEVEVEQEDDTTATTKTGMATIEFGNMVGDSELILDDTTATTFRYSTANKEKFTVTKFGYYITNVVLEGVDGAKYTDLVQASANATDVKGYYHVVEGNTASKAIVLNNVPVGKYNKITFTVGIPESGVQEGAQGGILDLAGGAWFWSWNAGYIGWLVEGKAENSSKSTYAFHVGGWKDVTPAEGQPVKFSNNTRTVSLTFDENMSVTETASPMAHFTCDIKKVLDGVAVDFSTTNQLHTPASGSPFANQLASAFMFSHIHASSH